MKELSPFCDFVLSVNDLASQQKRVTWDSSEFDYKEKEKRMIHDNRKEVTQIIRLSSK